jgi:hypothetical protein
MENLMFFIVGMLLSYLILQRPLQITIHHKNENVVNPVTAEQMDEFEKAMLTKDPKKDQLYEDFEKTITEIGDIMGGSDR